MNSLKKSLDSQKLHLEHPDLKKCAGPQSAGSNITCIACCKLEIICSGRYSIKISYNRFKRVFCVNPGLLKCSTCCNTGSGLLAKVSPGKKALVVCAILPAAVSYLLILDQLIGCNENLFSSFSS